MVGRAEVEAAAGAEVEAAVVADVEAAVGAEVEAAVGAEVEAAVAGLLCADPSSRASGQRCGACDGNMAGMSERSEQGAAVAAHRRHLAVEADVAIMAVAFVAVSISCTVTVLSTVAPEPQDCRSQQQYHQHKRAGYLHPRAF